MKTIVIIGAGNVASRLALALHKTNYEVVQIYNHHLPTAKSLAKKIGCNSTSSLQQLMVADLYIIAVKDDAIATVANDLSTIKNKFANAVLVHTSGSQSSQLLNGLSKNFGVLYPLQTLKKNVAIDFFTVPFAVLGSNTNTKKKLHQLARTISKKSFLINDEQRLALHVAAVFANNFTHHILVHAQQICKKHHLNWEVLQPLIERTFTQAHQKKLAELQTGPAIRGDEKTIALHLQFLKNDEAATELYKLITKSITESTSG